MKAKHAFISLFTILAVLAVVIPGVIFMRAQAELSKIEYTYAQIIEEEKEEMEEQTEETEVEEIEIPEEGPLFTSEPLPDYIIEYISGLSFKEETTLTYEELTYLTITHIDFDGENRIGNMIVAAEIGDEVLEIFEEIYEIGFPIHSILLVDAFGADDNLSMAANNTSAFNWRYVDGTTKLSNHAFGFAIDINPIQNPYVRGVSVQPADGAEYLHRSDIRPGMITRGDAVYNAFISRGWTWGGDWSSLKDYHHFEKN